MLGLNICQLSANDSIPSTSKGTTYRFMNLNIHPTTLKNKISDRSQLIAPQWKPPKNGRTSESPL